MKLSWSHKLFLRINIEVGKRRWLDMFMIFCARWLIYVLVIVFATGMILMFNVVAYPDWRDTRAWGIVLTPVTGLIFLLLTNRVIGLLWRHKRPIVELPQIKTLVHTLGTWKSFPSDHTAVSFYFAFLLMLPLFINSAWMWPLVLLASLTTFAACLIGVSRVYVGVHYPRDIVGGIIAALFFAYLSEWLMWHLTYRIVRLFL